MHVPRTRLARLVALALFSALGGLLAAQNTAATDPGVPRVVAVGDVHGDIEALSAILRRAGLIDSRQSWQGGNAIFVQTGDYMDRGPHVREVLDLFMSLEREAAAAGGKVIVLLGNHEAMDLVGELRDVAPEVYQGFADQQSEKRRERAFQEYDALMTEQALRMPAGSPAPSRPGRGEWLAARPRGYLEYREAIGPGGKYGKWLRKRPAVAKVGDILLVHGGINPDFVQKPIDEINDQVRDELARFDRVRGLLIDRRLAAESFTLQELVQAGRIEMERVQAAAEGTDDRFRPTLHPMDLDRIMDLLRIGTWYLLNENGPLWFRGYASWTDEEAATRLVPMLERYGVTRVVVGHTTVASSRITSRFSNRVFLIDTGMLASYYKGRASALEFHDGRSSALYVDGGPVRLDPE